MTVIGTLLYYSQTADSICTAVHALGSIQAKPTIQDMQKMEISVYSQKHFLHILNIPKNGIRYYASNMQLQGESNYGKFNSVYQH
jgi:hypothetical protein